MIRILTGFSNAGGSTVAFVNLTNALNKRGIDCILYGVHQWHLDKCRADMMSNVRIEEDDNLIIHFYQTNWITKPPIKGKLIYSCHEKDIRPMNQVNYQIYDKIHYVSKPQRNWHNITYPNFILPNIVDDLTKSKCTEKKIAGIIGSIDRNKRVDISIQRSLDDGMEKVLLFGNISDKQYYNTNVKPLIDGSKVIYMGHEDNKQTIYDNISHVYHSSLSETFGYIEKECELTGVKYHGNEATKYNFDIGMSNDEIIDNWKKELKI